jgi:hypothetical protein
MKSTFQVFSLGFQLTLQSVFLQHRKQYVHQVEKPLIWNKLRPKTLFRNERRSVLYNLLLIIDCIQNVLNTFINRVIPIGYTSTSVEEEAMLNMKRPMPTLNQAKHC